MSSAISTSMGDIERISTLLTERVQLLTLKNRGDYFSMSQDNILNDYDKSVEQILINFIPMNISKKIISFVGTMCYNKVLISLNEKGFIKKCHHVYDNPISYLNLVDLLVKNTYISLSLINGNELYNIRPRGRRQLDLQIGLVIQNQNIESPEIHIGLPEDPLSSSIHGIESNYINVVAYFKSMSILFEHFQHNGVMKSVYVPARANLTRTTYEVMMITLKKESEKYLDKPIYWKVDPIRLRRVQKLQQEILEPLKSQVKLIDKIRIPEIEPTQLCKYLDNKEPPPVFQTSGIVYVSENKELMERELMALEDFDFERKKSVFYIKFTEPAQAFDKYLKYRKPYPDDKQHAYNVYLSQPIHRFPTKVVKKVKNPDYISKQLLGEMRKESWQAKANLKMKVILDNSLTLTNSIIRTKKECEHDRGIRYFGEANKKPEIAKFFGDDTPARKIKAVEERLLGENKKQRELKHKKVKGKLTIPTVKKSLINNLINDNLPTDQKILSISENFSLKVLFYSLQLAGVQKSISCLDPLEMRISILRFYNGYHFRYSRNSQHKVKKRNRYLVDAFLSRLIEPGILPLKLNPVKIKKKKPQYARNIRGVKDF